MLALLDLITNAVMWTDIAKTLTEASPLRRMVLLAEWIGGGWLVVYLLGEWSPWPALAVGAAIVLLDGVGRRLIGSTEDEGPVETERTLSPEEIRVRAAAERAERDLAQRGSHPLGHPGSGGRLSD